MAINPEEDPHNWLKFASLCRKSGRPQLAHNTLAALGGSQTMPQSGQSTCTSLPSNRCAVAAAHLTSRSQCQTTKP
jgi:hypothetical protein